MQAECVTIENAQGDVTISRLVGASQVQVTDQLGNIALTLGKRQTVTACRLQAAWAALR